jgi:hypothetical protein
MIDLQLDMIITPRMKMIATFEIQLFFQVSRIELRTALQTFQNNSTTFHFQAIPYH